MKKRLLWGFPALLIALAALVRPATADRDTGPFPDRLAVKKAAAEIDSLVEAALKGKGLKPNPLADDATYARRTYLSIAGRIPTRDELESFLRSSTTDKHLKLVDQLLASPGHESRMFNWWADLLRTQTRPQPRMSGEPYIHWIKDAIAKNRPYDEMVRELLAANGPVHQRGNGATGYLMRDRNMPEDNMSNTIRLFLGSRVECAQCHNHPFDKWTQKQYFEMVAFTGGIQYRKNIRQDDRARRLIQQAREKWGRNGQRAMGRTIEPLYTGIYGSGSGAARLPKDYKYEDGKPRDWITAQPLFAPAVNLDVKLPGEDARIPPRVRRNPKALKRFMERLNRRPAPEIDSRRAFAEWMTARDNERFAKVVANRLWKLAFGRGLIEPVDDIKDDTEAVAPELLQALQDLMLAVDYDMRAFQRALYYTRLWRRQASAPAATPGAVEDLRGPLLRRMTAEQAWDSLLTLVVPDLDAKLAPPGRRAEPIYEQFEKMSEASDEELMEQASALALRYTDPEKARAMRRRQQAEMQQKRRAQRREAAPLYREFKLAKRAGDENRIAEVVAKLEAMGLVAPGTARRRGGRALNDLSRASDLPSPAPDGHLLIELGQSQRDLIEAGHTDPTVPQVLALLNTFLEQRLLTNAGALLTKELRESRGGAAKIKTAYLTVLGRAPTPAERTLWSRDVASGPQGTQDLVWTLVNSHEFLFIQ